MPDYVADHYADIRARMEQIAKEENKVGASMEVLSTASRYRLNRAAWMDLPLLGFRCANCDDREIPWSAMHEDGGHERFGGKKCNGPLYPTCRTCKISAYTRSVEARTRVERKPCSTCNKWELYRKALGEP